MGGRDLERNEPPTRKRRERAHAEGRVPRSPELTMAFVLVGSGLLFEFGGEFFGTQLVAVFGQGLLALGSAPLDSESAVGLLRALGGRALLVAGGWSAILMLVGLAIALPQGRGVLSATPLRPDFGRLNPLVNARRILGLQSLADLVKSLFKLALIGSAAYWALGAAWSDAMTLSQASSAGLASVLRVHVVRLLLTAGGCYLALGAVDYGWRLWRHAQSLRMSRQDVREELRQTDGDPLVLQRMRSVARARSRTQMRNAVRTAGPRQDRLA